MSGMIDPEKFLVVGPGYWASGTSLKGAVANARKEGMRKEHKVLLYAGSPDLSMTTQGYVTATRLIRLGELQ